MFRKATVEVRPATVEELEFLKKDLAESNAEQVDLDRCIVGVITKNGEIVQYIAGRLIWQVEPLKWVNGAENKCNQFEQKKATYIAIRWITEWLTNLKNNPFVRSYFCYIENEVMQDLALSFGMLPIYRKGKFFGKDLDDGRPKTS